MVGIVIVSHSRKLAEGVLELAEQMSQGQCSLAIAAGVDDDEHPIGTDAVKVMEAIEQVYDDTGVLILMDMGSALLSTETALDLIDPDMAVNVALCSAPLVEGTIAATVAAAAGLPLNEVLTEARTALNAKKDQLGEEESAFSDGMTLNEMKGEHEASWVLQNPHGLHARPAAALVTAVAQFDAQVALILNNKSANARSLNSLAGLGAHYKDEIQFVASGREAKQAVEAFQALAQTHFGEKVDQSADQPESIIDHSPEINGALSGLGISDGIVFGKIKHYAPGLPELPERIPLSSETEWQSYASALDLTLCDLTRLEQNSASAVGAEHANIFNAHSLMLSDPELQDHVKAFIDLGISAEQAWMRSVDRLAEQYRASDSEYIRQRATDIVDVGRRLLSHLLGKELPVMELDTPVILLANDLTPSDTVNLDPKKVLAICLSEGSKTSHSAILAKALGIPAIVKVEGCLNHTSDGQDVVLDGFKGHLWLTPNDTASAKLEQRRTQWLKRRDQERAAALEVAETVDGFQPQVMANISRSEDVDALLKFGAQGVGLLRTEFLFLGRDSLPDEEEQYRVYSDIASRLNGQTLVIRTLDIGGDKPLLCVQNRHEDNPFLGCRGIRLCLAQPELLKTQLRAIIRAADEHSNIQVMFPMIATVNELHQAKDILNHCRKQLDKPVPELSIGIMIEVPAAVFNAAELAIEADFFSIGTNDLTQYVMAADRGNSAVSDLVSYQQPAVLKAISETCKAAQNADISVGMCGEMAADPEFTALLLGMGISKLSASPAAVPGIKASIRTINMETAREAALSL